jgi:hypothetical protein
LRLFYRPSAMDCDVGPGDQPRAGHRVRLLVSRQSSYPAAVVINARERGPFRSYARL